jgi:hypothetical protein
MAVGVGAGVAVGIDFGAAVAGGVAAGAVGVDPGGTGVGVGKLRAVRVAEGVSAGLAIAFEPDAGSATSGNDPVVTGLGVDPGFQEGNRVVAVGGPMILASLEGSATPRPGSIDGGAIGAADRINPTCNVNIATANTASTAGRRSSRDPGRLGRRARGSIGAFVVMGWLRLLPASQTITPSEAPGGPHSGSRPGRVVRGRTSKRFVKGSSVVL